MVTATIFTALISRQLLSVNTESALPIGSKLPVATLQPSAVLRFQGS